MLSISENLLWVISMSLFQTMILLTPVLPVFSPILLRQGKLNKQLFGCLAGSWDQPTAIRNLPRKSRWKSVNGFTSLFLYLHVCLLLAVTAQGKVVSTGLCAHSCAAYGRCKHSSAQSSCSLKYILKTTYL